MNISENHFVWNGTDEKLKDDFFNNKAGDLKAFVTVFKAMRLGVGSGLAWKLSYEHDNVDIAIPFSDRKLFFICERPAMTMKRVPKRTHGFLTFLGKFYKHFRTLYYPIFKS